MSLKWFNNRFGSKADARDGFEPEDFAFEDDEGFDEVEVVLTPTQHEPSLWAGTKQRGVFDVFQRQDTMLSSSGAQDDPDFDSMSDTTLGTGTTTSSANTFSSRPSSQVQGHLNQSASTPLAFLRRLSDGAEYPLALGASCVIGRSASCDVCIRDDIHLSHRHAIVMCDAQGVTLADVGSLNGTWVGGRRLAPNEQVRISYDASFHLSKNEFRIERR